jgi:hypothetical protein
MKRSKGKSLQKGLNEKSSDGLFIPRSKNIVYWGAVMMPREAAMTFYDVSYAEEGANETLICRSLN